MVDSGKDLGVSCIFYSIFQVQVQRGISRSLKEQINAFKRPINGVISKSLVQVVFSLLACYHKPKHITAPTF